MKTLFATVLKSGSVAIVLLVSVFSLTASAANVTADRGSFNPDIKKVIVTGNTKVLLVQNNKEYVTMDNLDLEKVSLKQVGNTLTISSSESNPVTVTVYAKDLYRIDAADQASVKTSGNFNLKNLQVMLKDDAKARIKATTASLYTVIDGRAKLELIGTSDSHISKMAGLATIDKDKFAALKTESINGENKEAAYRIAVVAKR
ncbi:GIN domain-containing protein [Pedobacter sp. MR2016-24]|uniref:GIN domain-containing protein n=1 Tax=Pedobacter sp. MR2016-24 TaxID=2994466 RepID=UPI00224671B3|nr:DUF2807 domain-containing protein [Pedobacter sp. MR2016-24]MCX2483169.1 DUF2807 domain-containing protein [Pedobacter sp. MR2016-24]